LNALAYGGCRSWVKLPTLPRGTKFRPVLSDEEHVQRLAEFRLVVVRA
jgi:hypothetical protein